MRTHVASEGRCGSVQALLRPIGSAAETQAVTDAQTFTQKGPPNQLKLPSTRLRGGCRVSSDIAGEHEIRPGTHVSAWAASRRASDVGVYVCERNTNQVQIVQVELTHEDELKKSIPKMEEPRPLIFSFPFFFDHSSLRSSQAGRQSVSVSVGGSVSKAS